MVGRRGQVFACQYAAILEDGELYCNEGTMGETTSPPPRKYFRFNNNVRDERWPSNSRPHAKGRRIIMVAKAHEKGIRMFAKITRFLDKRQTHTLSVFLRVCGDCVTQEC